jgi:asparagine synthase (glutamine-hydrolysing)
MQPGVLAVSSCAGTASLPDVRAALAAAGVPSPTLTEFAGLILATWGGLDASVDHPLLLTRGARRHAQDLTQDDIATMIAGDDRASLAEVLPPFAALMRRHDTQVVATADALGFRHLYHSQQRAWAALSTSARVLSVLGGAALDRDALAVQSLLGWQIGQATLFEGVTKLEPAALVWLHDGRCDVEPLRASSLEPIELEDAVRGAAQILRDHLTAYVTDHPDATLQLTGGQDSRILLSAIPPDLRRGMRAVTLSIPGSADVAIAASITARVGMVHQVEALESLAGMDPAEAYALCLDSSVRLESMADPVALAALTLAERHFHQGHRIAGLGGEVARGFYYVGVLRNTAVTRRRVARLAAWRMFANEAVDPAALSAGFRERAREITVDRIHATMAATGRDWLSATDDFYLGQRMQRWAGLTNTAVCFDRSVVNPMLDDRFIKIARGMSPTSKRHSLFLAQLQMALDPELGRMPLDDRPPPEAYARPGPANRGRAVATTARKTARKVKQRLSHENRPPAGGTVLAGKVLEHWRQHPELLDRVRGVDVLDEGWLDRVLTQHEQAAPSAVALLLNLSVVAEALAAR